MDSSAIESKSNIVMQYHSEDFDLKLKVEYGIDWKKGVKVHDEPVTQLPDWLHLTMQHKEVFNLSYKFHGTQDCEVEKVGLLEDFVKSPVDIMKTIRFMVFYFSEKDTNGVHSVPQEEELSIRKVDEHEGTSTFSYRSNPVMDKVSISECQQINNFVGVHPSKRRLMSVLWLLSEFAVKCFEPSISLQYRWKDFKLKVEYGIDWKKGVKVHDEPVDIPSLDYCDGGPILETSVTQLPDWLHLTMQHEEVCNLSYKFHGTQDCEVEKVGLLEDFVKLPVDIMKIVRFITFYLLEKDTNGVHLVPQEEELFIRKVDEHEGTSTFSYRSNPVMDKAIVSECQQINNFVGVRPSKRRLMSVLWLLSEFAVKCFGKQDLSSKKPKQG